MWIQASNGTLVNLAFARRIYITGPVLEQMDWRVIADLNDGTAILFRSNTADEAQNFLFGLMGKLKGDAE